MALMFRQPNPYHRVFFATNMKTFMKSVFVAGVVFVSVCFAGTTQKCSAQETSVPLKPLKQETAPAAQKPELVVQIGHTDNVNTVAFSPDGRMLASGSADHTIKLWEVQTGQELRTLAGHDDIVESVAFSPDGQTLASGSHDNTIKLWDIQTGQNLRTLTGHNNRVYSVVFSPDGQTLASGSDDNTIKLWDIRTRKELHTLIGHDSVVSSVAFSPDGQMLASGSFDTTITLWEVQTGRILRTLTRRSHEVTSVAFSPDGQMLASGSADDTITLWDVQTGQALRTMIGHADEVVVSELMVSVAFSPDGQTLAGGSFDHTIKLWEVRTGQALRTLTGHNGKVYSVAFSPDGQMLASGSVDNTIKLWEVRTGQTRRTLTGHGASVKSVAFSPDGQTLISSRADHTIALWEMQTGQALRTLTAHDDSEVSSVAFSPDRQTLASANWDWTKYEGTIKLWEVQTGQALRTLTEHSDYVASVAFSPDGQTLASVIGHGTITLWEVQTGQALRTLIEDSGSVRSVAFSPDGQMLASGIHYSRITLWKVQTGQALRTLTGRGNAVNSIAFSPDGQTLASANGDGTITLWKVQTGQALRTLTGHSGQVDSVAFSPDGQTLASTSWDQTIQLWEVQTGQALRTLTGHGNVVNSIAFNHNGQMLASGSLDGTVKLWNVNTGKEIVTLIAFGEEEWLVLAPTGQFDASPGAMQQMYFVVGLEPIDLEQLKDRYYEPGLLSKLLGHNPEPLRDASSFETVALYPEMQWVDETANSSVARIRLTNRGGGIGRVAVFLNGKEINDDARARSADPSAKEMELTIDVSNHFALKPGEKNLIEVKTWNAEGDLVSRGLERQYEAPVERIEPPNLWAIVVGISDYQGDKLDLRFAAKDAEDMAKALQIGAKALFGVEKVHLTLFTSPSLNGATVATRQNVKQAFQAIAKTAKSTDIVVVYLAGHGVNAGGQDGDYFYLTSDARIGDVEKLANLAQRAMSSQELTERLKAIPALKQVLILDTCAAGRVVENLSVKRDISSSQIRALDRMKDRTGLHILAGAAADASSYEASRYGQGLLTYSLLRGMRGAALREDEYVDISTLFEFAADTVPDLARDIGGIQRPIIAAPYGGASFDIGQLTHDDKPQIPLATVRPLVVKANFQDRQRFRDHLRLTKWVNDALRELSALGRQAPLVFVDTDIFPDAYALVGQYTVAGNRVTVIIGLFRGETEVDQFTVTGDAANLEQLTAEIVKAMDQKM
ncbi:MAG: hypothetical protein GY801_13810 [bacterium]|nr:hypothetical protein [bacterium]